MFVFSRVATLQGAPADTIGWATEVTEIVNRKDGPETTLWQGLFGGPIGTVSWNTLVKSRAQYGEVMGQVMVDPDFHKSVERGQQFISSTPTVDYLRKYVAGTPSQGTPALGAATEMVTASPAPGRIADAMTWGAQIAMKVGTITGHTSSFFLEAYGGFGQMTWMSHFPDLAACDEAQDKLMTNEDYLGDVAKGTELFSAGSGERGLATRIA